jgi:hypothetical protein
MLEVLSVSYCDAITDRSLLLLGGIAVTVTVDADDESNDEDVYADENPWIADGDDDEAEAAADEEEEDDDDYDGPQGLKRLRQLRVRWCSRLTEDGLMRGVLGGCPEIELLDVEGCRVDQDMFDLSYA